MTGGRWQLVHALAEELGLGQPRAVYAVVLTEHGSGDSKTTVQIPKGWQPMAVNGSVE